MNINLTPVQMAALGGGLALLGFVWLKKKDGQSLAGAAGTAAVTAAADAAAGAVVGVGEVFGIPATSMTECERAKAEGRTWDASFACPAGEFLSYLVKPTEMTECEKAKAEGRTWDASFACPAGEFVGYLWN